MSGTQQRVAISRLNRFHVHSRIPNRSRSQPAIRPTSLFSTFTSLGERAQVYVILRYSSSVREVTSGTHDSSTTNTSLGELCPSQVGVAVTTFCQIESDFWHPQISEVKCHLGQSVARLHIILASVRAPSRAQVGCGHSLGLHHSTRMGAKHKITLERGNTFSYLN